MKMLSNQLCLVEKHHLTFLKMPTFNPRAWIYINRTPWRRYKKEEQYFQEEEEGEEEEVHNLSPGLSLGPEWLGSILPVDDEKVGAAFSWVNINQYVPFLKIIQCIFL